MCVAKNKMCVALDVCGTFSLKNNLKNTKFDICCLMFCQQQKKCVYHFKKTAC